MAIDAEAPPSRLLTAGAPRSDTVATRTMIALYPGGPMIPMAPTSHTIDAEAPPARLLTAGAPRSDEVVMSTSQGAASAPVMQSTSPLNGQAKEDGDEV